MEFRFIKEPPSNSENTISMLLDELKNLSGKTAITMQMEATHGAPPEISSDEYGRSVNAMATEILQRFEELGTTAESLRKQIRNCEDTIAYWRLKAEAAENRLQRKFRGGPVDGQAGEAD